MVKACCAFGCNERFVKGGPITFHSFPKDTDRRKLWESKLKKDDFKATDNIQICSKHFSADCFDQKKFGGTWLKKDAVPTLFDFPTDLKMEENEKEVPKEPITLERQNSFESKEESDSDMRIGQKRKITYYLGDFDESDMQSPTMAVQALQRAKEEKIKMNKKLKALNQQYTYLKKRFSKLMNPKEKVLAKCSVPACRGNYDDSNRVAVFGFPNDKLLREKWLLALPSKDFNVTNNSKVCERHFKDGEVLRRTTVYLEKTGELLSIPLKKPKLEENAVPSIFPHYSPHMPSTSSSLQESPSKRRQIMKIDEGNESQNVAETPFVIKQEPDESVDEPPLPIIGKVLSTEELFSMTSSSSSLGGPSSASSMPPVPKNELPIDNIDSTNVEEVPATYISKKSTPKRKINDTEPDAYDEASDATQTNLFRRAKPSITSNRKSKSKRKLHAPSGTSKKSAQPAPKRKISDGEPDVSDVAPDTIQDKLFQRSKLTKPSKRKHKLHPPAEISKKPAVRSTLPTTNRENEIKEILQFLVDGSERSGDLLDMFGNYIVDKLRQMDWDVCASSLRTILDVVSKASQVQRDCEIESDIYCSNTSSGSPDQE